MDPRTNKPFYIGKGSGSRVFSHEKFKSSCNNPHKDNVIKQILKQYDNVPIKILKEGFISEEEAYAYEELIIKNIGIKNLTNICESRRPPSQQGIPRSDETIKKIKLNSKKQGLERTIIYVKENKDKIFDTLTYIKNGIRRNTAIKDLKITIDLFNKIKKKYKLYIELLNKHTDMYIENFEIYKINGMKQKVFSDNKELLTNMFNLIKEGKTRKEISSELNIPVSFYDRFKNQQKIFLKYYESTIDKKDGS